MNERSLLNRWARLGRTRQLLLLEAVGTLAVASAALRLLPFKYAIRLGSRRTTRNTRRESTASAGWAVEAAARKVPWKAVCIQQGIALQWMLRRRGIDARLHYGVARGEGGKLEAHVWVAAGARVLIGGEQAERFTRLATFP